MIGKIITSFVAIKKHSVLTKLHTILPQFFMKKITKLGVILIVLVLVCASLLSIPSIRASFLQSTIGWIWGGMDATGGGNTGLGWISLNSRDCDTDGDGVVSGPEQATHPGCPLGGIIDYGVNVPPVGNGAVTGYGWSENYGWISFNAPDLTGCPSGGCSAQRVGNTLTGWARILSIRDNGANAGGWSGFIKLSSDASDTVPYGITITGIIFNGYAYSDEIGWIDFSAARISLQNVLKVCLNSCSSNQQLTLTTPIVLNDTDLPANVVACYNTDSACGDASGNVTSAALWSEGGPNDAVTLSGSDPKVVTPNSIPTPGSRTERITATYSGNNAPFDAIVTKFCAPNPCTDVAATCTGETYERYSPTPGCESVITVCTGTRSCNYNWKEVAP